MHLRLLIKIPGLLARHRLRLFKQLIPTLGLDEVIGGRIRAKQVQAVKRLTPMTTAATAACSFFLLLSFSDSPHFYILILWFWAHCAIGFLELRRWLRTRLLPPRADLGPEVIRRVVLRALTLALMWSIAAIVLFPTATPPQQVLLTCLVSGMLSGGAFALSPIPQAALVYVGVITPAAIVALLTNADGQLLMACVLLVIFAFFLMRGVIWNSHLFVQHILDEAALERAARLDSLTGLINRAGLREKLEFACLDSRDGSCFSVLFIDLDRFKAVNDTLGHRIGDALLRKTADVLQKQVGSQGSVARVGGDEFVVLFHGSLEQTTELATRLLQAVSTSTIIEGRHVSVHASIGVASAPQHGLDPDDLLNKSDMAQYRAKSDGRQGVRFFEASIAEEAQTRRVLESDLRRSLSENELYLEYQPIFRTDTERVTGCEALVRWKHPIDGSISPSVFIPLAEETGFIRSLGLWVLERALLTAARWPAPLYVAVNVSPVQLRDPDFVEAVQRLLSTSFLEPKRLSLEVTESVFMQDGEEMLSKLFELRQLGVKIALDDFGTGYSSLGYLRRFRFDRLKIDKSFVSTVAASDTRNIVHAIISLARSLGISTTAEGVETHEELQELIDQGCEEAQGFLFSRPISEVNVSELLRKEMNKAA